MTAAEPQAGHPEDVVHWIGDAPTSLHGNGAASFAHTTRNAAEVTCRLCRSILASDPPQAGHPEALTAQERYAIENAIAVAYSAGPNPRGVNDVSGVPTLVTRTVERILADRAARGTADPDARRERIEALREAADNMPISRPGQSYEHAAGWLRRRADAFAAALADTEAGER